MTATTAFDLDKLFEGSLRRLRTEAEYFSRLTDHNPELGRLNETHLVHGCRQTIHPAVMPGLDRASRGGPASGIPARPSWIAGSSPAMTIESTVCVTALVKLLREYLPPKIGIGTGFIVCGGNKPLQSPQCDIVLFDGLNNMPLYSSEAWSIYPIEMVYGVIEVKSTLKPTALEEAFEKCATIRAMAKTADGQKNKMYIRQMPA